MLNQTVIVGRLVDDIEIQKLEGKKRVANLTLAVPRSFKNAEGEYETDFIDCVLWDGVATNTSEYCRKGDLIGIKGRIQTDLYENKDGKNQKSTKLIAEKVTFLQSKNQKEKEEEKSTTNKNVKKSKVKERD